MSKIRAMVRASALAVARRGVALLPRDTSRRRVLFVCSHGLQADYLAEIWDILKSDPRLDFRLVMPGVEEHPGEFARIRRSLPLKELRGFWAHAGHWDLMIVADHVFRDLVSSDRRRIIRISHGFPGKRVAGSLYAFGPGACGPDGRIRYSRMFVPSRTVKDWAVRMDPAFEDVVTVVGSPGDDRMLAEVDRRQEYRNQFGFKPDEIVVFVTGTWGPHGLFHRMGDAILAGARKLRGEFRFVFSAHPHDYRHEATGERVWGEYLREQAKDGFLIREPWENWTPYMIASDVVLTDHTSLALHGALLGLPFVCCPVPEELVETGTVIRHIRDISPTIQPDASDLRQALRSARNGYPFETLGGIASQINSCPHQAVKRIREELYRELGLSSMVLTENPSTTTLPAPVASRATRNSLSDRRRFFPGRLL